MRFKGFEGEWEKKKLEEFIDIISGIALQSEDISENELGIPILRGINITEGFIRHSREIDRYYPKNLTDKIEKYLLQKGDIVIGMDGSKVGKNVALVSESDEGSILIQRVARVKALENAEISYIYQKIFSSEFHQYVDIVNTSSGIPHISLQQIKDFETGFPATIIEQQKIASFLTLIDERIATQSKIVENLETLMQSLREKLFTQKLRFKDENGQPFPDWEEKKLEEVAMRITTKNIENNQNVLTISAQYGLISQLEFFNKSVAAKNVSGYYLLREDDFAYNKSYSTGYPMGAIKRLNRYDKGVVSTLYICFRFNANINKEFMEHYFETGILNNEIGKFAQEGARNHGLLNIGVSDFFNIQICIPCFEEQTRIANFLNRLTQKIVLEESLRDKYTQQKKYLLQNLFI